ncbi:MAG: class I SAM-dependent RNA methyltransferase, partial [Planctomycetota bacterium]|nr:class I SAM-dependent RNA methyltransferase [Planctomycetota bacterium]
LAIEAALITTGRAPGLLRTSSSLMHTKLHDEDVWRTIRNEARKQRRSQPPPPIIASDIDPRALEAAHKNARTAGVEQLIDFVECDFAQTPLPDAPGVVILNPDYGERLGDRGTLELVYARIGDYLKQRCPGWKGYVFTGNRDLSKCIGLRADRRIPFMNAKIECRLLEYELYQGSLER